MERLWLIGLISFEVLCFKFLKDRYCRLFYKYFNWVFVWFCFFVMGDMFYLV